MDKRTRRKLNDEEQAAAFNILKKLPKDVIIYLLKTTDVSIADIIHFCELDVWTFKLCLDKGIWDEIYERRFNNRPLRATVKGILRQQVHLKDPETKLIIHLRFSPVFVQLVNIVNHNRHVLINGATYRKAQDRAVSVISNIYGPMDPQITDRAIWLQRFKDTLVTASLFRKMVLYTFLEMGYKVEWFGGGDTDIKGKMQLNNTIEM